jgi:cation diffusion facilitator family transporter
VKPELRRALRSAQTGMLVNTVLAIIKFVAGIVGNTYALVADAVESTADIFSSLIVWSGLRIAGREADKDYPFGYGRAEALAGAIVSLMLIGAAIGIAVEAIREIRTPHHAPAPWTLGVLVAVIVVKEVLFRKVFTVGSEVGSRAVMTDAAHHRSDVVTSAAAFIGIGIALIGGPGWEVADDWAALLASVVILYNGVKMMKPALDDLMDRVPGEAIVETVSAAALGVEDVQAIEKLKIRKAGLNYFVDLHVQADPLMSLHDAHIVSGKVKGAIRKAVPEVEGVLIHMEPFEEP